MTKRVLALMVALSAATLLMGGVAAAGCHAFTISVDSSTVVEGTTIEVTVSRDGAVNPSSIRLSTVDGTATSGQDFAAFDEVIQFTTETQQTREITTFDDAEPEPAETFFLHLSDPSGCAVNPNFVVGPDVEVTLTDNDGATEEPAEEESPPADGTPEFGEEAQTTGEDDDGLSTGAIAAIIGGIVVLGAGAGWLVMRQRGTPPGPSST